MRNNGSDVIQRPGQRIEPYLTDFSRFHSDLGAHWFWQAKVRVSHLILSGLSLECQGGMRAPQVIKPIDVVEYCSFCLPMGSSFLRPNQYSIRHCPAVYVHMHESDDLYGGCRPLVLDAMSQPFQRTDCQVTFPSLTDHCALTDASMCCHAADPEN